MANSGNPPSTRPLPNSGKGGNPTNKGGKMKPIGGKK